MCKDYLHVIILRQYASNIAISINEGGHALPRAPGMAFLAVTCMGMGKFS